MMHSNVIDLSYMTPTGAEPKLEGAERVRLVNATTPMGGKCRKTPAVSHMAELGYKPTGDPIQNPKTGLFWQVFVA